MTRAKSRQKASEERAVRGLSNNLKTGVAQLDSAELAKAEQALSEQIKGPGLESILREIEMESEKLQKKARDKSGRRKK